MGRALILYLVSTIGIILEILFASRSLIFLGWIGLVLVRDRNVFGEKCNSYS